MSHDHHDHNHPHDHPHPAVGSAPASASSEVILRLRDVTISAGGKRLLDRVSMELHRGDFGMLIGPNGGGKTTLVRAVLNLQPVQSGTIDIFGHPPGDAEIIGRIGYVPQHFPIERTLPLTVLEFMQAYAGTRRVFPGSRIPANLGPEQFREAASMIGMEGKLSQNVGRLSGGEMQRLLLAAAFLDRPELLILDEPLAGVDVQGEADFYEVLARYREAHPESAFLVVSHDIGVVYQRATRVFCLDRVLHAEGAPHDALNRETFEKLYGAAHFPGAHHHHVH